MASVPTSRLRLAVWGVALLAALAAVLVDRLTDEARGSDPVGHAAAKKTTELKLGKSRYGKVLFDGKGRALYLFTKDAQGPSQCYGACATAWPPFFAKGKLVAGKGVNRGLLATTTRSDGRRQMTYGGQPLYYYIHDKKPGQITCQNVDEFGGLWLVVGRSGAPVR